MLNAAVDKFNTDFGGFVFSHIFPTCFLSPFFLTVIKRLLRLSCRKFKFHPQATHRQILVLSFVYFALAVGKWLFIWPFILH